LGIPYRSPRTFSAGRSMNFIFASLFPPTRVVRGTRVSPTVPLLDYFFFFQGSWARGFYIRPSVGWLISQTNFFEKVTPFLVTTQL